MHHETQVGLLKRLLSNVTSKTKDMSDAIYACPVSDYADPDRYRRELETIFRHYPIVVGHSSQLARSGDFFTHDKTGVPILVVRHGSGALKAFINVCRHRGAIVERKT